MLKKKYTILFGFLALCSLILSIYSVFNPETLPYYLTRPSFLLIMTLAYVTLTKKPYILYVSSTLLINLGEFLQYYSNDLLTPSIACYCLGLISVGVLLLKILPKVPFKKVTTYFFLFLMPFLLIYFGAMDSTVNRALSMVYGVVIMFILALCLLNYFQESSLANAMLLAGFTSGILASAIVSSSVLNIKEESLIWVLTTFFSFLNHFLVTASFIVRPLQLSKKEEL